MNTAGYLIVTVLVAIGLYFALRALVRAVIRYRGARVVTCPETGRPIGVEVDARHALLTSLVGQKEIRLENCGRWPLLENCGQECLIQLDVAPPECLVRSVLTKWYRERSCIYCGKRFDEVRWFDHKPALQSPAGLLTDWSEVRTADLNEVLGSYLPVCWDCNIAQTFVREHPDLAVVRPWTKTDQGAANTGVLASRDHRV